MCNKDNSHNSLLFRGLCTFDVASIAKMELVVYNLLVATYRH